MRRTAALIVGGGPAGAAAAITLARGGRPHLLVERSPETGDVLCGGFLSWRSLATLAGVGIAADALNPVTIDRVRLFAGSRVREARLPGAGLAVSRRRLDRLLIEQAVKAGARIERGVTVRDIADGSVRLADGTGIAAPTIFLASGKHDVRGMARPAGAWGADPTLGLRVRIAASPRLAAAVRGVVELHLFRGGYAGLALQEDGSANLCMAVHRSRLTAAGDPIALIARLGEELPALGERLADWDRSSPVDAVANVPYGWRATIGAAGTYRLGDQAAVIPSLAGEGMGIALASGISAATHYLRYGGADADRWQRGFAARSARPVALAGIVRRIAEGPAAAPSLALLPPGLIAIVARLTRIDH